MKKRNYVLMAIALGMIGAFGSHSLLLGNSTEEATQTVEVTPRPIPTAEVAPYDQTGQRLFPGSVQAKSRVELAFNMDGQIIEMNVLEGEKFKKGTLLARLDQRDFRHAYEGALANAERLQKEFERMKALKKQQVVSQAEFDLAKTSHDVVQAELKIRKKALDDTLLLAPYDGVVAKRYVQNFQHIKRQDKILAFKDISLIEVVIQVPERLIAHGGTQRFSNIKVRFDADRSIWLDGEIKEYAIQPDSVTRTFEVVVGVEPPGHLNILPGMTASVSVDSPADKGRTLSTKDSMIIPIEAVFGGGDGLSYCWIIPEKNGNPEKRRVEIGVLTNQGLQIKEGLKIGDRVATAGLHSLHDRMNVRPAVENWEGLDG